MSIVDIYEHRYSKAIKLIKGTNDLEFLKFVKDSGGLGYLKLINTGSDEAPNLALSDDYHRNAAHDTYVIDISDGMWAVHFHQSTIAMLFTDETFHERYLVKESHLKTCM